MTGHAGIGYKTTLNLKSISTVAKPNAIRRSILRFGFIELTKAVRSCSQVQ